MKKKNAFLVALLTSLLITSCTCNSGREAAKLTWKDVITNDSCHNGEPLVLIYHTHTRESYSAEINGERSSDQSVNVVSVGKALAQQLYDQYGIESLQITSVFDIPYEGSYDRSLEAYLLAIEEYPTIKYVFDVHRDAYDNPDDKTKKAFTVEIDGNKAARVETVIGGMARFAEENKAFEAKMIDLMNDLYPGLYKSSIHYDKYYYNQFVMPNSLIFEVGSIQNTPEEAQRSAGMLADCIGRVMLKDKAANEN